MHSPCCRQKDAAIDRHGRCSLQQVLERRLTGAARMIALDRLRQLHLVADQDYVAALTPMATILARLTWPASSTKR